ncbi:Ti-type conjugative transfer relaxase TraA [Rhizobium sp. PP-F2F-G20b]|nr:Ti-type conjugative transfer relaxase TraA [Rhizobium sp. PP-F2F-G20b]
MAIYHCSMKPIARSGGRSAVASAAYRAAEKLTNERDGLTHDFRAKQGVEHAEIVLPEGVDTEWARDRSALWNAAEKAENRKDARVAREFEVALPHELTAEQRIDLTREFAQELANRHGAAVDFAVHQPHSASDVRNHHAHIMMTTRQVTGEGLADKTYIERENKWLLSNDLPTSQMQLRDIRQSFEQMTNAHLARAGLDIRVDHRSHAERGLEIEPTEHAGVHATQMQRRGQDISRARLDEDAARRNADLIREKPEEVLAIITGEKSVFDRHDVARALHRYINDDAQAFQNAFATVMASPALVALQPERTDSATGRIALARYSTREMVEMESGMAKSAERLQAARTHGVDRQHVDHAIRRQNSALRAGVASDTAAKVERGELDTAERDRRLSAARLSGEQQAAIEHVTGPERIAVVVGYAGAGKSTMLTAAREAWQRQGYQVQGAALSGKAAEGLEESSGIASRTLASWEMRWQNDRQLPGRRDVFVIDEAGMVGSRQLARFVREVEQRGAKIVLVGDHEQLQAIGAGAPFRAIAEQIGHSALSDIRRQRVDWQRAASVSFATHKTAEGLAAYRRHGDIRFSQTVDDTRSAIVRDTVADLEARPQGSRVAMAHRRADVSAINADIRSALQETGRLTRGEENGELSFQTSNGRRAFVPSDRLVFLENDRDLGVKNGMLGTVRTVESDAIQVQLDGGAGRGQNKDRLVTIPTKSYQSFDHGYATTIHKTQGATVDRAFVMASKTMDRHLTYVAMTRHRDSVQLYASQDAFTDAKAGKLVAFGTAPYAHDPKNRDSTFVTIKTDKGETQTVWGTDLKRAMEAAAPEVGAAIRLERTGSDPVRLPDGSTVTRNRWSVLTGEDLAFRQLEERLSRSGVKETTLDYTRDFAHRRGIAEKAGIRSEITVDRADITRQARNASRERTEHATASERPAPLVPAITRYDRGIEEVAREKAASVVEHRFGTVASLVQQVFRDPEAVTRQLRMGITEKTGRGAELATLMARQPERFGELRGRSGLLGENKERKQATEIVKAVAAHIGHVSKAWDRRLDAERTSETWQREKRDGVEVPGLTPRSFELIAQVEKAAIDKQGPLIDQLRSTPEGRIALDEAKRVADALTLRFGHSDPRNFAAELEKRPEIAKQAETIKSVARIVERTRMAELTRDHTLKQQLSRTKGLGLSR